jgi:hypothetical protein
MTCPACEDSPRGKQGEWRRNVLLELGRRLVNFQSYGPDTEQSWYQATIQAAEGLLGSNLSIS